MKHIKLLCNAEYSNKFLSILIVFIGLLGPGSVTLGDSWVKKADMLKPMSSLFTVVINGKIYAIGSEGEQALIEQRSRLSEIEEYDPVLDVWMEKAKIPTERINSSICVVNNKIYIIGGYDSSGLISKVEEYNPTTDTWTRKANMLTPRAGLSTCTVNGKIYAIGGENLVGDAILTVEEYNPVTDKWTKKADTIVSGTDLSTCVVNGKIYVIGLGGIQPAIGRGQVMIAEYVPNNDSWTRKADLPANMINSFVTAIDGKIYAIGESRNFIAGGANPQERNVLIVMQYDPIMDMWTQKADISTQQGSSCIAVVNGKIYVIGGSQNRIDPQEGNANIVMEYDPKTDIWTRKTDMPTPRSNSSAAVVNGKIYVIGGSGIRQVGAGGMGQRTILTTVEEYIPDGWQSFSVSPIGKMTTKWGAIKTQN